MTATSDRMEHLTATLRAAASRAAELVGGGSALVFATLPGESSGALPRLRAAAGFGSLDEARTAASDLSAQLLQCAKTGRRAQAEPKGDLAERAAAGVHLLPIVVDEQIHGTLVVGAPVAVAPKTDEALQLLTHSLAVQIDHLALRVELETLRSTVRETLATADEKGDEILQLSETLFAQDIELLRSNETIGQIEKIKSDFIEKMSKRAPHAAEQHHRGDRSRCWPARTRTSRRPPRQSLRTRRWTRGRRFQRTLQNILDLWRIKQGEMPVEIQDLNFSEVDRRGDLQRPGLTVRKAPWTIQKRIPEDQLPKIKTDLAKVNQLLFLLLDNAAKFTQRGHRSSSPRDVEDGVVALPDR